ncbi:MFS transporter [Gryllotalpicola daejeonensis]|uniref:MFS transporter n=1 Tax=Gryllotalpicola daejeonensis TaxID=993087 RepID=A0ABP7ZKE5_9MICO
MSGSSPSAELGSGGASGAAWLRPAAAMFVVGYGANMFATLLDVYRGALSAVDVNGLFGAYALGLIPALILVAPLSDRFGRRLVVRGALLLSAVGSLMLLLAGDSFAGLLVGRVVVGVAAGSTFSPGTAWVKELSDRAGRGSSGARRAAVALTAGFAGGPLLSGVLSQWVPLPEQLPYAVHVLLVVAAALYVWRAPETVSHHPGRTRGASEVGAALRSRVFLRAILPTAPWVFGAASASLAVLPGQIDVGRFTEIASGITAAVTLGTGILVQSWARRLAQRSPRAPFQTGVAALVIGMLLGAATVLTHSPFLLAPAAICLGAAYGFLLVSGLNAVDALARPDDLATLTGIFYSATYVGFAFPLLESVFAPAVTGPGVFLIAAALGAAAFAGLATAWPRGT